MKFRAAVPVTLFGFGAAAAILFASGWSNCWASPTSDSGEAVYQQYCSTAPLATIILGPAPPRAALCKS